MRARSGVGFKRSQDKAGQEQEERGEEELLDPAFWKQSTAGYCAVVVGKLRIGVRWRVSELALELSHQRHSAPPSSASSRLIKLAFFSALSTETPT